MKKVLNLYKKIGETPLECMERFRAENPEYRHLPMTYAGRLDPLAEGELLVLVGDECKKKEEYLGLDKEYEIEVLFGVSTDTFDLLGQVEEVRGARFEVKEEEILKVIPKFIGKFEQEYPKYSSKTVLGKPLFALAKSGRLPDEMPSREVEIYKIETHTAYQISNKELLDKINSAMSLVKGDFRQDKIRKKWNDVLLGKSAVFDIYKFKILCSSGTYMRSFANSLGRKLNIPALAYSIKRTKIDKYCLKDQSFC